jgi:hypothetical protein
MTTARPAGLSLAAVLKQLLPAFNNSLYEAAEWLNWAHRTGRVHLLADGKTVDPGANPGLLAIKPVVKPDDGGPAALKVQARKALDRDVRDWTIEAASFNIHRPRPVGRGGHPQDYPIVEILTEALIYVAVRGLPKTLGGEGGLFEKLTLELGSRCPQRSRLYEIFRPINARIKAERSPGAKADDKAKRSSKSK